jgi:all-trans-retinol 13,14-reductase
MRASKKMDQSDGRLTLSTLFYVMRDALTLTRLEGRTIGEVLEGLVRDPRLKAVLLGQSGDYGLPPSRVSAFLHLGLAGHYFRGAFYPKGGGQVIADRVAAACERAGGSIHLRRGVERILVERGRAVGVSLRERAGEPAREVWARCVLSNADLQRTLLELVGPEHLPASWTERARGFEMAAALYMTFLGVSGDLCDLGMRAANYWQFDGYDMEAFYRDAEVLKPRGCYVTSASLKDPENALHHAPAGVTNVEVMTVVSGTGDRWGVRDADADAWAYGDSGRYAALKQSIEDQMVARLDRLFPGSAARVVYRESATPVTHRRFTGAAAGTG